MISDVYNNFFKGISNDSIDEPSKKVKGRTGWPQHVWASELKQEQ